MDVAAETVERRYVIVALVVVTAVAGVLAIVDIQRDRAASSPARIELMRRCLYGEKLFPVYELPLNSYLAGTQEGGLRALAESTNWVNVAIAGSDDVAIALEQESVRRTRNRLRVERRGDIVIVWSRRPTQTQRQALLDCSY